MALYKLFPYLLTAALFSVVAAKAADMSRLPTSKRVVQVDEEPIPGFYLRGDIGTATHSVASASYNNITTGTINPLTGASVSRANMGGIGMGFKSGYFRVDTTVDYRNIANYSDATPCFSTTCGANTVKNSAKVESVALMLNGYIDLGTWFSFTPYVGAGFGLGMVTMRDYKAMAFSGSGVQTVTEMGNQSKNNLAYSLMAGTSYAINKNFALDVGYRYLNLGEGWTKATAIAAAGTSSEQWNMGRLTAHEIRAGIRYTLD